LLYARKFKGSVASLQETFFESCDMLGFGARCPEHAAAAEAARQQRWSP
jgi:hypothetical protein